MNDGLYHYKAKILRWVDGDSVWLDVDLGFRISAQTDFRLWGVDTPERGQLGYVEAIAFVNEQAPVGTTVYIDTYKVPDKYGRWLVEIRTDWSILTTNGETVNQLLINAGLAIPYFGGKR